MRPDSSLSDIERLIDQLRAGFDQTTWRWDREFAGEPTVDVVEYDDEYVVTIDVPGFDKSEVRARLDGRRLTVTADHEEAESADEDDGRYLRRERHHESVRQEVVFPDEVNTDAVSAQMKHGVLTVTVSKAEPGEGSHTIDIE